jgi:single-strand DNA-binding protein
MANFNKVIVAANLVSDPELKSVGDSNVVRFRVAINRKFTTKSGEKKEESTYIDAEMWGARASVISEYLKKGDPILMEGHLKQENWETKDGEKRSKILVAIEDFEFMNGKKDADSKPMPEAKSKPRQKSEVSLQDIPF